jgi:circadian clock protein KaiC
MDMDRVATGIDVLDDIVNGGFRQGKSYLISGESGTGKTAFGLQFMQKGLELGEAGVYVTADEQPGDIIDDAQSFGFSFEEGIAENHVMLLDYSSHFDSLREHDKEIDVSKIVSDLNKYIKQIGAKRLVIDPIAPFVVRDERMWEIRRYIRSLFYSLESLGCTTVITSAIPIGSNRLSLYGVEEFYASGVIVLQIEELDKLIYKRTLLVRKMRGSPYKLEPHLFDFEYGKGIVIRKASSDDLMVSSRGSPGV